MNDKKHLDSNLTCREKEIISNIIIGMGNKEIGIKLYISESTVKKHVYNIFNKLEIHSRFELISICHKNTCNILDLAC